MEAEDRNVMIRKMCIKDRNFALQQHAFHKGKFDNPATSPEDKVYAKNKMQYWGGRISQVNSIYQVFNR